MQGEQLEPIYQELLARVDGLTVDGKPVQVPGLPSKAEMNALVERDANLFTLLDDEEMTIQNQRKNGSIELRDVRLGDTMQNFERLVDSKRPELEYLMHQLREAERDIASAYKAVVETELKDIKKAEEEFAEELASLEEEAGALKRRTRAKVEKARKEDQEAKVAMDRKIEELIREF